MPEIKFHKSDKFTFFTVDNYFTEKELDIIWPEIHSFDNQLSRDGDHRAGDVGTKGVFIHDKPLQYHQISLKWKFGNHPSVFLDQDITFRYMRNLHFSTCLLNYYVNTMTSMIHIQIGQFIQWWFSYVKNQKSFMVVIFI